MYKRIRESYEREINSDRTAQVGGNNTTIQLSEIRIENNLKNKTKFKATVGEEERIILKKNDTIYFNDNCIIQAKKYKVNPESMYYEIELLDFDESFELLFGYANKSSSKIHELHILLNSKIYGVNINEEQYSNTFVHTLKRGDIIGCFYDLSLNEVTFTYNGSDLCYYQFNQTLMYPTIYSTKGTLVKYNLGDQPFHYRRANQLKLGLECNYIQELPPSY
ncbi:hypothetical protein K502DRAFT_345974 [Neoconidiobolus thromboides FSU 785]|nr:hypothetical protein K502DRAFT_345974 [Neoconidiobolus thromboides FSU 785]